MSDIEDLLGVTARREYPEVVGPGPVQNVKHTFKNWLNFKGRARREEWWTFWFLTGLVSIPVSFPIQFVQGEIRGDILTALLIVPWVIAGAALTVRRVHDTDKDLRYALLVFVPFVGMLLMLKDGTRGPNKYGPSPKYPAAVEAA